MSHHWDYGPDKTKGERRSRKDEKKRERMDQGKRAKLWAQIIQQRAAEAQRDHDRKSKSENGSSDKEAEGS